MMTEPRKQKKSQDDDVQKVVIEDVGPKAKAVHEKAVDEAKASAFTKEVWLALFGSVVAITTSVNAYFQYRQNELARTAAVEVKGVKEALTKSTTINEENMEELKKTTDATHTLVNANFGAQLKISAVALRQVADYAKIFDKDRFEKAEAAAILAEKLLKEHELKQGTVDDREAKDKAHKESRTHVPGERVRLGSATRALPNSRSGVALAA